MAGKFDVRQQKSKRITEVHMGKQWSVFQWNENKQIKDRELKEDVEWAERQWKMVHKGLWKVQPSLDLELGVSGLTTKQLMQK